MPAEALARRRVIWLYCGFQFFFSLLFWVPVFYAYQKRIGLTDPQIFSILEGPGEVSGADGVVEPIVAGEAVFLHEGEEHEMTSDAGLKALDHRG